MGAPYFKAVCMGRAMMIPGMVGKNAEQWIAEKNLPRSIAEYGETKEELFATYEILRDKYGAEVDSFPLGAIGLFTYVDKLKVGLQQIMAGTRNMSIDVISRDDVFALTEEASRVSGIPYVMDAYRDAAHAIIRGQAV